MIRSNPITIILALIFISHPSLCESKDNYIRNELIEWSIIASVYISGDAISEMSVWIDNPFRNLVCRPANRDRQVPEVHRLCRCSWTKSSCCRFSASSCFGFGSCQGDGLFDILGDLFLAHPCNATIDRVELSRIAQLDVANCCVPSRCS